MTDLSATRRRLPWRLLGWGFLAALLSLPAILRFPWTASDFVIMGILLGSVGLGVELVARLAGNVFVRLGAVLVVLTCFLTVWVNLAVGMVGSEDNPYNLLFLALVGLVLIGAVWVKLAPVGMARVTLVAAAAQAAFALGGAATDMRGAIFSGVFAFFWLLAAALFRAGASR